ncbi:MAG: hypothetical protein HFJ41_04445 [Clostridia bacterium]|nr:hypothetical protein [Clostridia bacterium]
MIEIKTTKGTWRIYGINFNKDDATYYILQRAIEAGNLKQRQLQYLIGWTNSIIVDKMSKEIHFLKY